MEVVLEQDSDGNERKRDEDTKSDGHAPPKCTTPCLPCIRSHKRRSIQSSRATLVFHATCMSVVSQDCRSSLCWVIGIRQTAFCAPAWHRMEKRRALCCFRAEEYVHKRKARLKAEEGVRESTGPEDLFLRRHHLQLHPTMRQHSKTKIKNSDGGDKREHTYMHEVTVHTREMRSY